MQKIVATLIDQRNPFFIRKFKKLLVKPYVTELSFASVRLENLWISDEIKWKVKLDRSLLIEDVSDYIVRWAFVKTIGYC